MSIIIDGTGSISGVSSTGLSSAQTVGYSSLPTGSVLQVVSNQYSTATSISGGSYPGTSVGLTASITPKFSTSKILVLVNNQIRTSSSYGAITITRGATVVFYPWAGFNYDGTGVRSAQLAVQFLDSPATTSSITYTLNAWGGTMTFQQDSQPAVITLLEIAG